MFFSRGKNPNQQATLNVLREAYIHMFDFFPIEPFLWYRAAKMGYDGLGTGI